MKTLILKSVVFLSCLLCGLGMGAKTTPVAAWGVIALGDDRNHLPRINGEAIATINIVDGKIIFSLWHTESKQSLGPSILLDNLYLDNSAAESNSYIGMRSKVHVLDATSKSGTLNFSLSKEDAGGDILHFIFGGEHLYVIGELIDEDMVTKLSKLAAIGTGIESGGKLKRSLEDSLNY